MRQFCGAAAATCVLQGGRVLDRSQQPPNPCPGWISEEAWDNLASLEQLPAFKGLTSSLDSAAQDWELWFRQAQPEAAELPRDWEAKCNELQRLLLTRSLRPDRVIFAATTYVANAIGRQYVEPPVLDLGQALADSSPLTPLIFVLSPGVDPTDQLRKLAAEKGMGDKLHTVALGQGQVCGQQMFLISALLTCVRNSCLAHADWLSLCSGVRQRGAACSTQS